MIFGAIWLFQAVFNKNRTPPGRLSESVSIFTKCSGERISFMQMSQMYLVFCKESNDILLLLNRKTTISVDGDYCIKVLKIAFVAIVGVKNSIVGPT